MKRGIVIVSAAAAIAAAVLAVVTIVGIGFDPAPTPPHGPVQGDPGDRSTVTSPVTNPGASDHRIRAMERRYAEMQRRLDDMDRALDERAGRGGEDRPTGSRPAETTQQVITRVSEGLAGHLADEVVADDWAPAVESEIAAQMASGVYPGVTLERAECRSTLCRVEMRFADKQAVDGFVARALPEHPWKYSAQMVPRSLDDYLAVDLYIAREGHTLPPM